MKLPLAMFVTFALGVVLACVTAPRNVPVLKDVETLEMPVRFTGGAYSPDRLWVCGTLLNPHVFSCVPYQLFQEETAK